MPDSRQRVAIVGTRFGSLDIETEELSPFGVELVQGAGTTLEEIVSVAGDAIAILAGAQPRFTREVLSQLPACRLIVRYGVGTDTIDLRAATDLRIVVANVPDYCTEEVATHTLALILACVRRLWQAYRDVLAGRWHIAGIRPLFSTENQVLGVVGFGKIGRAVARKARAFGFTVLVFDPYAGADGFHQEGVQVAELEELLSRADVVSLHAPLTEQTYHLMNATTLALMKPTAYLVNTSRGGLVDEAALEVALREGVIAGAALDVLENELAPSEHPLVTSDRVLITPHAAWYTEESAERMRRLAAREVARMLSQEWPTHVVNPQVADLLRKPAPRPAGTELSQS